MKKLLLAALMGICLSGTGYAKEIPNKASKEVMVEPVEIVEEEKPLTKSQSFMMAFGMGDYSKIRVTRGYETTTSNNMGTVKAKDGVTTFTPYRYTSNHK